jgi:hypothetical protein
MECISEVSKRAEAAIVDVVGTAWHPRAGSVSQHIHYCLDRMIELGYNRRPRVALEREDAYLTFREKQKAALSSHINFFQPISGLRAARAADAVWAILEQYVSHIAI